MDVFNLWMKVQGSTKRPPPIVNGKRGVAVENLSEIYFTPFTPASQDNILRAGLQSPLKLYQTFTRNNQDVVSGDTLVVQSTNKSYPIRATMPYDGLFSGDVGVIILLVEEEKAV